MFSEKEKVVYSGHGVAQIIRITDKKIANTTVSFFELKFLSKDMTILVPVLNAHLAGMRSLSTKAQIDCLLAMIAETAPINQGDSGLTNWNKRNKEYQIKIRTGDLIEIGEIYRDLNRSEQIKELSFGEKDLMYKTESFLIEEISLVTNQSPKDVEAHLRLLVKKTIRRSERAGSVQSL